VNGGRERMKKKKGRDIVPGFFRPCSSASLFCRFEKEGGYFSGFSKIL